MMKIFVSSPYGAVFKEVKDEKLAREIALKMARAGARAVLEMGHLPLSPVLAFDGVYDEKTQRELAIAHSLEALKWCDGIMSVRSPLSAFSKGMILEEDLARRCGKVKFEFEFKG